MQTRVKVVTCTVNTTRIHPVYNFQRSKFYVSNQMCFICNLQSLLQHQIMWIAEHDYTNCVAIHNLFVWQTRNMSQVAQQMK